MVSSVRSNLQWFNRYVQLLQVLAQNPIDLTRPVGELSQSIARTGDTITDACRQMYDRQQMAQERINFKFLPYFKHCGQYRSPFDSRLAVLPSDYQFVWTNPSGEFLLGDSQEVNSTNNLKSLWRKAEKVR